MTIRKYRLMLLGLLLATLISCSSPPSPPLIIAVQTIWPTTGTAFIAEEKGLFAKYGVQVTLLPITDYMECLKLYKEGRADVVLMVFGDAIISAPEGVPTSMVYAMDYSDTADFIVEQPTLKSLSDLKGKNVSFDGFNTFSHLFVLKLLEQAGVREGEFQMANLNPTEVLEALETGKIQAGHVYGKTVTDTLAKGYKILGKAGEIPHLMVDGLMVKAAVVKTRPADVQGLVKALAKGGQEIIDFFYQKGVLVTIPDLNTIIDDQFIKTRGDKQ